MAITGLLRSVELWRRVSDERAVLYECVESHDTGRFAVIVAHSFKLPIRGESAADIASTFVEQIITYDEASAEGDEKRAWFSTPSEAVAAHDYAFDDEAFRNIPGYREAFGYEPPPST